LKGLRKSSTENCGLARKKNEEPFAGNELSFDPLKETAMMKQLFASAAILLNGMQPYAQRPSEPCKQVIAYENHNQADPDPLSIRSLTGQVIAEVGAEHQEIGPIPGACLGLFTDEEHRLVATATADQEGRFQFGKIPNGKYRLVIGVGSFCTANVPLQVTGERRGKVAGKRQLVIHMAPGGIDQCSYGDYK
jgi:hypothetical protein